MDRVADLDRQDLAIAHGTGSRLGEDEHEVIAVQREHELIGETDLGMVLRAVDIADGYAARDLGHRSALGGDAGPPPIGTSAPGAPVGWEPGKGGAGLIRPDPLGRGAA